MPELDVWYHLAMRALPTSYPSWIYNPLIRRGWQHDGRSAHNPADPPVMPQKIPN